MAKAKRKTIKPFSGQMLILPAVRERDGSVWVLVKYPRKRKHRAANQGAAHAD